MRKKLATFTPVLGLFFLAIFVLRAYFSPLGLPETHDGINHLARFANYYLAVREGQIPPRIAPALFNHYGYPVFNYNYPLANILSLPFSFLKFHYETTFKIISSSFVIFGILACYYWLKEFGFKTKHSFLAAATLALSPFLYNLINFRGNIGEIMAMMLYPGLFLLIEKIYNQKINFKKLNLVFYLIIFSMFLLSHNVTVLFGLPILFVYALLRFGNNFKFWQKFLIIFLISFLNSLWFWLPAILEKNQVILDENTLSLDYVKHFPSALQLLFSPLKFGFSFSGNVDSQSFALGIFQTATLIFSLIVSLKLILVKKIKPNILLISLFSMAAFLVIFQLSFTKSIWQILPLANYIQFPWRLSLFLSIILSFLVASISKYKQIEKILIILIIWQIIVYLRVGVNAYSHFEKQDYEFHPKSTSSENENLPKTFLYQGTDHWQASPEVIGNEAEIVVEYWKGSDRQYSLKLSNPATIIEPTMYYLGWESEVKNQAGEKQKLTYIDDEKILGRIAYQLPAGNYEIRSRFTQNTLARILGNSISCLSFLGIFIYYLYRKLVVHD